MTRRVVVFDLDDTLYLERDFVRSGFEAVDRWLTARFGARDFFERAWQLFVAGRRGDVFDQVLPRLGLEAEPQLIRQLVAVYRDHQPALRLEPAAEDLLASLSDRCPLAILTDGYHATQRRKVVALRLEERCRPIVCTDAWGRAHWKPDPKGFVHIQNALGLPPERCTYIGDNPHKDFRAPKALGWRTIRVRHPEGEHAAAEPATPGDAADRTITSLADLEVADLLSGARARRKLGAAAVA